MEVRVALGEPMVLTHILAQVQEGPDLDLRPDFLATLALNGLHKRLAVLLAAPGEHMEIALAIA